MRDGETSPAAAPPPPDNPGPLPAPLPCAAPPHCTQAATAWSSETAMPQYDTTRASWYGLDCRTLYGTAAVACLYTVRAAARPPPPPPAAVGNRCAVSTSNMPPR